MYTVTHADRSKHWCIYTACKQRMAVQQDKVEEEVVSQAGHAAAQLPVAMLSFRPSRRPTAAQALQLFYFRQQPPDMPPAGRVSCGHQDGRALCC